MLDRGFIYVIMCAWEAERTEGEEHEERADEVALPLGREEPVVTPHHRLKESVAIRQRVPWSESRLVNRRVVNIYICIHIDVYVCV